MKEALPDLLEINNGRLAPLRTRLDGCIVAVTAHNNVAKVEGLGVVDINNVNVLKIKLLPSQRKLSPDQISTENFMGTPHWGAQEITKHGEILVSEITDRILFAC